MLEICTADRALGEVGLGFGGGMPFAEAVVTEMVATMESHFELFDVTGIVAIEADGACVFVKRFGVAELAKFGLVLFFGDAFGKTGESSDLATFLLVFSSKLHDVDCAL